MAVVCPNCSQLIIIPAVQSDSPQRAAVIAPTDAHKRAGIRRWFFWAGGAAAIVAALAVAWFLVAIVMSSHAAALKRQRILLDSDWRFYRGEVAGAAGETHGLPVTRWRWMADDAGATDAGQMADPALDASGAGWKDATTGQDTFNGRVGFAWFRTTLPENSSSARTLHFDGVDDNATVYLNGRKLASHEGWDDPFDVDLKLAWKEGGPNVLAVLVENTGWRGWNHQTRFSGEPTGHSGTGPALPDFDENAWRVVHLPHDFIVEGIFDAAADRNHGYLPTTTGWYRKTFDLPAAARGKSLWIDFDGIYRDSSVWLNGQFLGRHRSGYTSFRYDISRGRQLRRQERAGSACGSAPLRGLVV